MNSLANSFQIWDGTALREPKVFSKNSERIKKPVSVHFRLRLPTKQTEKRSDDRYVAIRISVNGQRDAGFLARERLIDPDTKQVKFGDILAVNNTKWCRVARQVRGNGHQAQNINDMLTAIKHTIKEIHDRQKKQFDQKKANPPTVDSVKYEYLTGNKPTAGEGGFIYPDPFLARKGKGGAIRRHSTGVQLVKNEALGKHSYLLDVVKAYEADISAKKLATGKIKRATYDARRHAFLHLKSYPEAQTVQIYQLSPYWLESYHNFLLTAPKGNIHHKVGDRKMNEGTATRYCKYVDEALLWLKKQRLIKKNPIGDFSELDLPGYKTKEVYFLEPLYLERLFALTPPPRLRQAHWWFRLICLTGLDYPDAVRYAQARSEYETVSPGGNPKIVIRRAKPPENECNIPMKAELFSLWNEVNGVLPDPINYTTLLLHLKSIAKLIGFSRRLTPKIGRKTAGNIFLGDHSIQGVSNILGHSSIAITEKHYVKVRGYHVDSEMDKKQHIATPSRYPQPFTHIYKAS